MDFGASSYWIATAVPSPWYETTGIDVTSSVRRKSIRLVGQGAKLIRRQITGKGHTSILQVRNNWDTVEFEGLEFRWEDLKDVSASFEWWEGLRVSNLAADNADMERLTIRNCLFWDCNRAWTVTARAGPMKATRGKLKQVLVQNCQVLYPHGSNWRFLGGGSQGEYLGNWVGLGEVIDCTFDGAMGGDVSGTVAKKPKDGFLMGEPLHRVWRGGVARHFDLEGAYCNVQNGIGRATFTMPGVGETVTLDRDQIGADQVEPGDIVRIDQIGAFQVAAKQGGRVTLKNLGTYTSKNGLAAVTNVPPGTAAKSNYIALDWITGDDCSVLVEHVRSRFPACPFLPGTRHAFGPDQAQILGLRPGKAVSLPGFQGLVPPQRHPPEVWRGGPARQHRRRGTLHPDHQGRSDSKNLRLPMRHAVSAGSVLLRRLVQPTSTQAQQRIASHGTCSPHEGMGRPARSGYCGGHQNDSQYSCSVANGSTAPCSSFRGVTP